MITLEQLDELEGRIVRALELIGDLRSENSRLESENERLRSEHDELKLALDDKEKTVQSLREQLDITGRELNDLKQKESVLEKRITEMLSRLSDVEKGKIQPASRPPSAAAPAPRPPAPAAPVTPPPPSPSTPSRGFPSSRTEDVLIIEDMEPSIPKGAPSREDESVVFLEDEDLPLKPSRPSEPPTGAPSAGETVHGFARQVEYEKERAEAPAAGGEEDIIILDDEEDDVIFADDEEEIEIIEQSPRTVSTPSTPSAPSGSSSGHDVSLEDDILLDDEDIGIFDMEDDDDFLIVEEDIHKPGDAGKGGDNHKA